MAQRDQVAGFFSRHDAGNAGNAQHVALFGAARFDQSQRGGQHLNAATGHPDAVRAGFASVTSPGRCEVVHREPTVILDAAHNPHGAKALADTLLNEFNFDEIIAVVGVFGDKDATGIFQELEQVVDHVIVTQSSSTRAMPSGELEKIASKIFGADRVFEVSDLGAALDRAVGDAVRPLSEDTVGIIVTGSVVTVGEARTYLRKKFAQ